MAKTAEVAKHGFDQGLENARELSELTTKASMNAFSDATKVFGDFRLPGLDVDAVVATQRKNLEALTHANQLAVEGVRALAQRQSEIAQQAFAGASALVREWTQPGAPEERLAKTAEAAKHAVETG